jgi:hypothetical protein
LGWGTPSFHHDQPCTRDRPDGIAHSFGVSRPMVHPRPAPLSRRSVAAVGP